MNKKWKIKIKNEKIYISRNYLNKKRKINFIKVTNKKVKIKKGTFFISSEQEKQLIIASGDLTINKKKQLKEKIALKIFARKNQEFIEIEEKKIKFLNTTPNQFISIGTGLIPFLEHDDANRALMGSNMQRQAIPLIKKEKPLVQTGLEKYIAKDSQSTLFAKNSGKIKYFSHEKIIINEKNKLFLDNQINKSLLTKIKGRLLKKRNLSFNKRRVYKLEQLKKSNQNTMIFQIPIVKKNQIIQKGQVISDGTGTKEGKVSLGKNLLLGYLGWEGYNFEDAVIINENIINHDTLTSISVKKYKTFLINNELGEVRTKYYHLSKNIKNIPFWWKRKKNIWKYEISPFNRENKKT